MGLLILGKMTLVAFMVLVMVVPILWHLKKDKEWEAAGEQLDKWYQR